MNINLLSMLAAISSISFLMCMEAEFKQNSAGLPPLQKPYHKLDFKNELETVDALTKNDAVLLRTLVSREQNGKYSRTLHKSEQLLYKWHHCQYEDIKKGGKNFNATLMNRFVDFFVCSIKNRQEDRKRLLTKFSKNNTNGFTKALTYNPHIANAYGCFRPYTKQLITPLHHLLYLAQFHAEHTPADLLSFTRILLEHGANPNAYDAEGNTPLHIVPTCNLALLLIEFGGKSLRNRAGRTPLMHHIAAKNENIAKILVYDTQSINNKDHDGDTALFYAVQFGLCDIVQELLRNGADCTLPNKVGNMITDIAKGEIRETIQHYLQISICHALKNNQVIQKIINRNMYIEFKIGDISIMTWAKKHCRRTDGYLHAAVVEFNELLMDQLLKGGIAMGQLILEKENACPNMINQASLIFAGLREESSIDLPLSQLIQQEDEAKIQLLLDHGAIVTQEMIIDASNRHSIYPLIRSAYDKQLCYKCHQHHERMHICLNHDWQACMVCSACSDQDSFF